MSILEEIEGNAVTNLILSKSSDEYADDSSKIMSALSNNKSILAIRMEGDFLDELSSLGRGEVLEAIKPIPTLRSVHLGDSLLMVKDIAEMLAGMPELLELTMEQLVLQGIKMDFELLESNLHAHPNLKFFKIADCTTSISDISLDSLTKSAQKISTISAPVANKQTAKTA
eukprot:scaffold1505_cov118-Cylindrotheca_fusiformis.AAC.11